MNVFESVKIIFCSNYNKYITYNVQAFILVYYQKHIRKIYISLTLVKDANIIFIQKRKLFSKEPLPNMSDNISAKAKFNK